MQDQIRVLVYVDVKQLKYDFRNNTKTFRTLTSERRSSKIQFLDKPIAFENFK